MIFKNFIEKPLNELIKNTLDPEGNIDKWEKKLRDATTMFPEDWEHYKALYNEIDPIKAFNKIEGIENIDQLKQVIHKIISHSFTNYLSRLSKASINEMSSIQYYTEGISKIIETIKKERPCKNVFHSSNKITEQSQVKNGLRLTIDCKPCNSKHIAFYQPKATMSIDISPKHQLMYDFYSAPCRICLQYNNSWTQKYTFHLEPNKICIICDNCIKKHLRNSTNQKALRKDHDQLNYICYCKVVYTDKELVNIKEEILKPEWFKHKFILEQTKISNMMCVLCSELLDYNQKHNTQQAMCQNCIEKK